MTNCAFDEPQVLDGIDALKSAFYLTAVMEALSELPGSPETEESFQLARRRLWTHIEGSGIDEGTLTRLATILSGERPRHLYDP